MEKKESCIDAVKTLVFSPDANHIASLARAGKQWCVVLDDAEGKMYDNISAPCFSPDSKHFVYEAQIDKAQCIVEDGKESWYYDAISALVFSPDSRHLAYTLLAYIVETDLCILP